MAAGVRLQVDAGHLLEELNAKAYPCPSSLRAEDEREVRRRGLASFIGDLGHDFLHFGVVGVVLSV